MKKSTKARKRSQAVEVQRNVGLDIGDEYIHYHVLDERGDFVESGRMRCSQAALHKHFAGQSRMRMAMETGAHSPWISRMLKQLGHEVVVANARKLRAITHSKVKNDRNDAELLARFASFDVRLLSPIEHRSEQRQQDLNVIHARAALVRARTLLINVMRGLVKSAGGRLPKCSSESFSEKTLAAIPADLLTACEPLNRQVQFLTTQIDALDVELEAMEKKYPEISLLRTVPGVGPLVSACYVLTLDRPQAMKTNRQAGAYLGLRPAQQQSGDSDPQRRISREGNGYLRGLLVQSAHSILGRNGKDCALRRWGLKLAESGGKRGKKRAIVAVARKLAVLLHSMWRNQVPFQAFPETLPSRQKQILSPGDQAKIAVA
jgi:transposase